MRRKAAAPAGCKSTILEQVMEKVPDILLQAGV
jgi:hypothetical protein